MIIIMILLLLFQQHHLWCVFLSSWRLIFQWNSNAWIKDFKQRWKLLHILNIHDMFLSWCTTFMEIDRTSYSLLQVRKCNNHSAKRKFSQIEWSDLHIEARETSQFWTTHVTHTTSVLFLFIPRDKSHWPDIHISLQGCICRFVNVFLWPIANIFRMPHPQKSNTFSSPISKTFLFLVK